MLIRFSLLLKSLIITEYSRPNSVSRLKQTYCSTPTRIWFIGPWHRYQNRNTILITKGPVFYGSNFSFSACTTWRKFIKCLLIYSFPKQRSSKHFSRIYHSKNAYISRIMSSTLCHRVFNTSPYFFCLFPGHNIHGLIIGPCNNQAVSIFDWLVFWLYISSYKLW